MARRSVGGVIVGLLIAVAIASNPVEVAASGGYVAADHFQRTVSNGWGWTSPGGQYAVQGTLSDYWVSTATYPRGLGYMSVPRPGVARGALLPGAQATNVELRFSAYMTAPAGDGPFYIYAVGRSMGSNEFRARIVFNRDCTVSTNASIVQGGKEQALGAPVKVPRATWCGISSTGRVMSLRAQVFGTNPTTVRVKAWSANGATEPSNWMWSATTETSLLSAHPGVGLRAYVSSGATNNPVQFVFYNWFARAL